MKPERITYNRRSWKSSGAMPFVRDRVTANRPPAIKGRAAIAPNAWTVTGPNRWYSGCGKNGTTYYPCILNSVANASNSHSSGGTPTIFPCTLYVLQPKNGG